MKRNGTAVALEKEILPLINSGKSPAVMQNRLEALTVLSNSILREVEALKKSENIILSDEISLQEEVDRFERDLIRCALLRTGGRQRRAARLLKVKVTTLNAKIKRLGISTKDLSNEPGLKPHIVTI